MTHVNRLLGLARSIAIYHGIPGRQRRLRRFYSLFAGSGDVVFDIGAHAGNRSRAFAALGCRVVAVEPQPDFARLLRLLFRGSRQVTVLESAVGTRVGRSSLSISERTPTVTTLDESWREARGREPDFSHVTWDQRVEVETTTLDALIERFGMPAFVKIDVEGGEPDVLAGLTRPVPALSFEYLPRALDYARRCTERLDEIAAYEYHWSFGESSQLADGGWMTAGELLSALATPRAQQRPGDVYARLASADARRRVRT